MNLEPGEVTGFWIGRGDGGWEPVDGIASIELNAEDPPVEDTTAFATEFGVTKIVSWAPACPAGIHLPHPDLTCEEHEELSQSFRDFLDRLFAAVREQAQQAARRRAEAMAQFLDGWEPRGPLGSLAEPAEPTPIERALQILAPHLAHEPLYQPRFRMGRWVPRITEAPAPVAEQPPPALASDARPAWQSPCGPPPRRPR